MNKYLKLLVSFFVEKRELMNEMLSGMGDKYINDEVINKIISAWESDLDNCKWTYEKLRKNIFNLDDLIDEFFYLVRPELCPCCIFYQYTECPCSYVYCSNVKGAYYNACNRCVKCVYGKHYRCCDEKDSNFHIVKKMFFDMDEQFVINFNSGDRMMDIIKRIEDENYKLNFEVKIKR